MISVICVFSNKFILNNYLLKSLKNQAAKYELILLNNTEGKYKSAAQALNYGGKRAKGEYLMFVHQDVDFLNASFKEIEEILNSLPKVGIVGVAGKNEKGCVTNILHLDPPRLAGKNQIQNPIKVETVDECLFIIPKKIFTLLQFDEKTCDNWHLYAVDYSLSIREMGYIAYVIPITVYHKGGNLAFSISLSPFKRISENEKNYFLTLKKIISKHKQSYKRIYTTVENFDPYPFLLERIKIKILVKNILNRFKNR